MKLVSSFKAPLHMFLCFCLAEGRLSAPPSASGPFLPSRSPSTRKCANQTPTCVRPAAYAHTETLGAPLRVGEDHRRGQRVVWRARF